MTALPSSLALATIADGSPIIASTHRSNYAAIQTAVNALVAALSGGTVGQVVTAIDGTDIQWAAGGVSGAAGGALAGTYPNPILAASVMQGHRIESGSFSVSSIAGGGFGASGTITFGSAFGSAPNVILTVFDSGDTGTDTPARGVTSSAWLTALGTSSFAALVSNGHSGTHSFTVYWLAIGT